MLSDARNATIEYIYDTFHDHNLDIVIWNVSMLRGRGGSEAYESDTEWTEK